MDIKENKTIQILTCQIGEYLFGMDVQGCRETNKNVPIAEVPLARDYIAGIVNLRGDVATVLNLHVLLGFDIKNKDKDEYVIIRLRSDKKHIAIKADRVIDVFDIDTRNLEPIPSHLDDIETGYLSAAIKTDQDLVLIIDTESILNLKH